MLYDVEPNKSHHRLNSGIVDSGTPQSPHFASRPQQSTYAGPSDDVLVTMFQGGDEAAFRALVERHKERVRNMIFNVLHDPDIIDDMAQDIFIKVFTGLPAFRFDSAFTTWLYRITVNRCRDELRKRRAKRFFSLHDMLERRDRDLMEQICLRPKEPGLENEIRNALSRLPAKYRIPVVLRDIDGLSYVEIAEVMNIAQGTVKSRIARGRSQLRSILAAVTGYADNAHETVMTAREDAAI